MASSSPSASPDAVPPRSADSPPPTSVLPQLVSASSSSKTRAPPSDSPSPSSSPPQAPPPPPSGPSSNDSSSSPPPPPAPLAPLPGGSSSPPPPQLVPLSPTPPSPPPLPPITPLSPPPPPHSPKNSPQPPFTGLPTPPPPDPPAVSPPPPRPPPTSVKHPKSSPPPPPSNPTKPPQNSPPPPPKISTPSPPSIPPPSPPPSPTGSTSPSRLTPPPTHSPSTSPPIAPSPPPSKQAAVSPASTLPPQTPTPSSLPSASSPTPIPIPHEMSSVVKKSSGIGTGSTVGIGVGIGIFILSIIGLLIWGANRRRRRQASRFSRGHIIPTSTTSDYSVMKIPSSAPLIGGSSRSEFIYSANEPPGGLGNSRLWFTYDDLAKATNGFSAENFLGKGGFGSVYRGRLQDGREVAVKQLKVGAKQGDREFRAEVDIISRIHHRYLVSLVGYCIAEDQKLLVYDYVPKNTLYFHLHGEKGAVLDWATRVKIAIGTARGLAYLHEDCHPRIIHRDIKSSNILLDSNFEARVSDFGLAKLALDAHTHITTRVMGTFGYMAPEYAISGKLTEKSDVYSFGVVLLELITGRKPVDTSQPLGDEGLVEWARPLMSHTLEHKEYEGLADPRLQGRYVESEMFRMIEAAAACVRHSATKRPQMGQIVRAFNSFLDSDLSNGMRLGESELFDSAQQSLEIRAFQRMQLGSRGSSTEFFSQTTMTR